MVNTSHLRVIVRLFFPHPYNWIPMGIWVQAIFLRPLHLIIIYKDSEDIIGHIPLLSLAILMDLVSKPQGQSVMSLTRLHFSDYLQ